MTRLSVVCLAGLCAALLSPGATSYAELHARLGGAAAYDDVLDITWLTDAGLSGSLGWADQLAWVAALNAARHLGFDDWRLASMSVASGLPTGTTTAVFDCDTVWEPLCRDNELSYMFFHNLGGAVGVGVTGEQTVGDVTLTGIQSVYWSGTEYAPGSAWILHFNSGFGVWSFKSGNRHAWAVRPGDVAISGADADGDGIADAVDNCRLLANPAQRDTDGDGYGNRCDADLNNDGIVNAIDLGLFRAVFFSADPDADFDGDGVVNPIDLGIIKALFFLPPGPAGTA